MKNIESISLTWAKKDDKTIYAKPNSSPWNYYINILEDGTFKLDLYDYIEDPYKYVSRIYSTLIEAKQKAAEHYLSIIDRSANTK